MGPTKIFQNIPMAFLPILNAGQTILYYIYILLYYITHIYIYIYVLYQSVGLRLRLPKFKLSNTETCRGRRQRMLLLNLSLADTEPITVQDSTGPLWRWRVSAYFQLSGQLEYIWMHSYPSWVPLFGFWYGPLGCWGQQDPTVGPDSGRQGGGIRWSSETHGRAQCQCQDSQICPQMVTFVLWQYEGELIFVQWCQSMSIDVNCICGQSLGESLARSLPPRCGACAAKTMRHWPWCRDRGPHHRRGRCSLRLPRHHTLWHCVFDHIWSMRHKTAEDGEGWKEVEAGCLAHLSTAWGTKAWDGHEKLVLLVASAGCVTLRAGWLQRLWWTISLRPRLLALEINCRVDDAHTHRHYIDIRVIIETYTHMRSVNMWRAQHLRWCA